MYCRTPVFCGIDKVIQLCQTKSLLPLFSSFMFAFCAFQEVDGTDEESANHRTVRVLQRSEVHRCHKQGNPRRWLPEMPPVKHRRSGLCVEHGKALRQCWLNVCSVKKSIGVQEGQTQTGNNQSERHELREINNNLLSSLNPNWNV